MAKTPIRETDLYPPVKNMLEGQGYEVKSEIGALDVMAVRDGEPPVIVELKTGFSLSLVHQAIERQAVTDAVYVAVPYQSSRASYRALKRNLALCRRLGLGLITVRPKDGHTQIHCDPGPYQPRKSKPKTARLLKEFARRVGDPNQGGATRSELMTGYRQDALKCLCYLHENGPTKASVIAKVTGVDTARRIMWDDHYGWFERVALGIYSITPNGYEALKTHADAIKSIRKSGTIAQA